jgi:hypothetical protein
MKSTSAFSIWFRGAGLPLGAASCVAILLAASPAAAGQCARGQIYWKSKHKCIEKAEAAKLGFYHGPIPNKSKSAPPEPVESASEPAPATPEPPIPPSEAMERPVASASPYGDLVLEEFAKDKSSF